MAKSLKQKRFAVLKLQEEALSTNSREEALKKIDRLQQENVEKIYLRDDQEKQTQVWTKERYDKNYKITSAPYITPEIETVSPDDTVQTN